MLPATTRRVIENTSPEINERIERQTECNIAKLVSASPADIDARLAQLDQEWDIERALEANASALAFTGILLALAFSWYWLLLPLLVTSMLFLHAFQGWCPPVGLFRRLGIRTETEINQERFALKVLRKDFEGLPKPGTDQQTQAQELLQAVKR
jgi:hypothetical protein